MGFKGGLVHFGVKVSGAYREENKLLGVGRGGVFGLGWLSTRIKSGTAPGGGAVPFKPLFRRVVNRGWQRRV